MAKYNTEDEPKRLNDDTSTPHRNHMVKVMAGMQAYVPHKDPNNKNFDPNTYAPNSMDDYEANRQVCNAWIKKRGGPVPQMIR